MRILLILALSITYSVNGQTLLWGQIGYVSNSGGGTFLNVDNSGVDITVSGLVNDSPFNNNTLHVGLNDGDSGVVSNYNFVFSQPVNISFSISDVNKDTAIPCYYDLLTFYGNPVFTNYQNVQINGNQVIPFAAFTPGVNQTIDVTYNNITSFNFDHGLSTECNPGRIYLSPINFEVINTSSIQNHHQDVSIDYYNNLIIVGGLSISELFDYTIVSLDGKQVVSGPDKWCRKLWY